MYYVGIDFGSCFSKITIIDENCQNVPLCSNYNHDCGIPTEIAYFGNEKFSFGNEIQHDILNEQNYKLIKDIKTKLRNNLNGTEDFANESIPYIKLTKKYIEYLFNKYIICTVGNKEDIGSITITVPNAGCNEKEAASNFHQFLKNTIATISGISAEDIFVQTEPVSAALSYFESINDKKESVLVFDLGGSTLDVAVVECNRKKYSVECFDGNNTGSNSLDEPLKKFALEKMCIIYDSLTPCDRYKIDQKIEECKISLSTSDQFWIDVNDINLEMGQKRLKIKVNDLNKLTKKLIDESNELLLSVIDEYISRQKVNQSLFDIEHIILVGGGTKTNSIKKYFNEDFKNLYPDIIVEQHKDSADAISKGAALYSYLTKNNDVSSEFEFSGVALHTYGINIQNSRGEEFIHNLIFKGQKFNPDGFIVSTSPYKLNLDLENKKDIIINVYESDTKDDIISSKSSVYDKGGFVKTPTSFTFRVDDLNVENKKGKINVITKMYLSSKDNIVSIQIFDNKLNPLVKNGNCLLNPTKTTSISKGLDEYVNVHCSDFIEIDGKRGNILCNKMKQYDVKLNLKQTITLKATFYQDCELHLRGNDIDFEFEIITNSKGSEYDSKTIQISNESMNIRFPSSVHVDNDIMKKDPTHTAFFDKDNRHHDILKVVKMIKVKFYKETSKGLYKAPEIVNTKEGEMPIPPQHNKIVKSYYKARNKNGKDIDQSYNSYFIKWDPDISVASETNHTYKEKRDHSERDRILNDR